MIPNDFFFIRSAASLLLLSRRMLHNNIVVSKLILVKTLSPCVVRASAATKREKERLSLRASRRPFGWMGAVAASFTAARRAPGDEPRTMEDKLETFRMSLFLVIAIDSSIDRTSPSIDC